MTYVLLVVVALSVFELPGLGIGNFFYVPIALLALAAGPVWGAFAGGAATGLYVIGISFNHNLEPTQEAVSAGMAIRLIVYVGIGALIGWSAQSNRDLLERLRVHAEEDFLTGLMNVRAFEAAVARRLDAGDAFALLLVDVDNLKGVNDTEGHAAGNDYLRTLANTLTDELEADAETARIGGDEFGALVSAATGAQAAAVCRNVRRMLGARGVHASIGYALYPAEGRDSLTLFREADKRLYQGKVADQRPARLRSVS